MLAQDDLKRIAAVSGPCLTIFEPLRSAHLQGARPDTGITAAIQKAGQLLTENGFDSENRDEMLRPLLKVAANTDWTGRKGSLILFRAPGFTTASFWPDALAPLVHFGGEFYVLPLLPGLQEKHDYWLLALSLKKVRLFRGSRDGIVEIALPGDVPGGLSSGDASGRHGTTSAREPRADRLHDFFKSIDRGIHPILTGSRKPLILAGATRELSAYRRVNTYPSVLAGGINGSPDALGETLLFAKAGDLMSAYSNGTASTALRDLEAAADHALLIKDPLVAAEAAGRGQVGELIVSCVGPGFEQNGETINRAALATIRNSGKINVLTDSRLESGVAAVLRFRPVNPVLTVDAAAQPQQGS